jgi:hypothetical protein
MKAKRQEVATPIVLGPPEPAAPVVINLSEISHSLIEFPWPYQDASINEFQCVHLLQKVPGKLRGNFMDEVWRVLVPEGKIFIAVPYYSSLRSIVDYAYEWPPFSEWSFLYFNKEWRTNNKVHPELKCDFDFTYGTLPDPETKTRTPEVQADWSKHRLNVVTDLQISLIKRK